MQKNSLAMTLMPNQSRLINAAEGFRLEVIRGCLWLTRPDDSCDYFLVAGMSMSLNERLVLIQSDKQPNTLCVESATFRLVPLKTATPGRCVTVVIGWKARLSALIAGMGATQGA